MIDLLWKIDMTLALIIVSMLFSQDLAFDNKTYPKWWSMIGGYIAIIAAILFVTTLILEIWL